MRISNKSQFSIVGESLEVRVGQGKHLLARGPINYLRLDIGSRFGERSACDPDESSGGRELKAFHVSALMLPKDLQRGQVPNLYHSCVVSSGKRMTIRRKGKTPDGCLG